MAKFTNAEMCLLWLDSFETLEYKHKVEIFNLINAKDNIAKILSENKDNLVALIGQDRFNAVISSTTKEYFNSVLSEIDRNGIIPITIYSKDYPVSLKETPVPPLVLYAKGDISLLTTNCFGMVGSRKSSSLAIRLADEFASKLSNAGLTLVTGIAEGVDKTVIESALKEKGKVISVIAGGFGNLYPKQHVNLFNEVVKSGLVLSEHPFSVAPKPYMFPVRNRIIAGLSKGVLIVSAGRKSGAIYTAEYAEEYSRDVFAIPYSVGTACGEGTNDLIKRGASLCDDVYDILSHYGLKTEEEKVELDGDEQKIVNLLKDGQMHVEKICEKLNRKIFEITPLISLLEIKGYITQSGINEYSLCKSGLEE